MSDNRPNLDPDAFDYAFFARPCFGERVSGDITVIEAQDELVFVAIVDVLGHGREAYNLAVKIRDYLQRTWSQDLVDTMLRLHTEIKGSRGAAVGLGLFNKSSGALRYTGVGNTSVRKFGTDPTHLYSKEGIVGEIIRTPVEQGLRIEKTDIIVFYTDGVRDHFELEEYPQLLYHKAGSIARTVVHRFGKTHDDSTCIVLRYNK